MSPRVPCILVSLLVVACSAAEAAPLRPTNRTLPPTIKPKPTEFTGEETGALAGLSAAHNQVRAGVGVAPLVWSPSLSRYAQDWATQLAANNCQLAHRPNRPYGENLFWTSSGSTAQYVVDFWAAEAAHYDIETNGCDGVCGHYTQIVWAATTHVGCGMASCGSQQVWVCNYDPPGNLYGQKPY
jgi:pathogenesis-related protein 1